MQETIVLLAVKPKWCEKIANGWKDLEIRKNFPKLKPPFRVVIYCTKENINGEFVKVCSRKTSYLYDIPLGKFKGLNKFAVNEDDIPARGTVIGEFVCDGYTSFDPRGLSEDNALVIRSCVPLSDLVEYASNKPVLYGWHIGKVTLYDKPKKLCEFTAHGVPISKAPQSWCYIDNFVSIDRKQV